MSRAGDSTTFCAGVSWALHATLRPQPAATEHHRLQINKKHQSPCPRARRGHITAVMERACNKRLSQQPTGLPQQLPNAGSTHARTGVRCLAERAHLERQKRTRLTDARREKAGRGCNKKGFGGEISHGFIGVDRHRLHGRRREENAQPDHGRSSIARSSAAEPADDEAGLIATRAPGQQRRADGCIVRS